MQPELTCAWDEFAPAVTHFCERELCAWIEQPANTWSNLAYVIVGLYVWHMARREGRPDLTWIGLVAALIGVGSGFFHASSTYAGEVVDLGSMYLLSSAMISANLRRLKGETWPASRYPRLTWGLTAGSVLLIIAYLPIGIPLFVAHVLAVSRIERRLRRAAGGSIDYRALYKVIGLFAVSWGLWWLDYLHIACDPDNHVAQGHAAWHVINSGCFYFFYRFYAQFEPAAARA